MPDELLIQAEHDLGFLCDDLERAHKIVDPVSEIVLRRILARACELRDDLTQLMAARESRAKGL